MVSILAFSISNSFTKVGAIAGFASVIGHRPTQAPEATMPARSSSVVCVAWIRHQRASTG